MIKIIRTLLTTLFLYLCLIPSLSSQTYVDLAIKQIILPDSIVFCENRETPVKVSISLIYGVSIDSFQVSYQLDNRTVVTEKVNKKMLHNDVLMYEFLKPLSKDSFINNNGTLKISITILGSQEDYSPSNNYRTIGIRIGSVKKLPYTMDFDNSTLPPLDWLGIKRDNYSVGTGGYIKEYVRGTNNSYTNSLVFQDNNIYLGLSQIVKSPVFDLDTADLAYFYFNHAYGNSGTDTLTVEITTDCGVNYQTIFKKGGSQLWTMYGYQRDPYNSENWGRDSFNLEAYLGQKLQFRFSYKAKSNDVLYIDDVRVANRNVFKKDVYLVRQVLPDNKPICPSDRRQMPVEIVLRNNGKLATDTIIASFRVNNNNWVTEKIVNKLNLDDTLHYTFTQLLTIPDTGAVVLSLAIGQVNEQNTSNDTLKTKLNVRSEFQTPFYEGFETDIFPPKDFPTEDNFYSRYSTIRKPDLITGSDGRKTHAVQFVANGGKAFLTTAPINIKSVQDPYLGFDLAYLNNIFNSLTIEISTDCGLNFAPIYYKSGDSLQTSNQISYSAPTEGNQWRHDSVSLLAYKNRDVMIRFVSNNFGSDSNIYLDNINVFNRQTPQKDAAISSIKTPVQSIFCPVSTPLLPLQIGVSNTGLSKIDTFIVSYKINNTPSVSDTVLKSLAFGETYIHTFKKLPTFPKGGTSTFFYTIKLFGDLDIRNDTLSNKVTFPTQFTLPFTEIFDTQYSIYNNNLPKEWKTLDYYWGPTTVIGSNGLQNVVIKHPFGFSSNEGGWLTTPYINLKNSANPYLTFDIAYARPDTYRINRLKIEISTDCGATFRPTVYDKTKKELETFNTTEYYPQTLVASNWRRDTVDLTPFKDTSVIIRFVGYSSNGTPIYLDNIRVEAGFAKDVSVLARIFPDTTPICFPQRHVPLRVAIRNDGFEKADTFKLSYRLDTEGVVSQTFIKRLNFRDTAIFTFSQLMNVVTVGNHNLTISVAANGDLNGVNDTLQSVFRLRPQYKANISEGLEGSNFPPQDWTIQHTEPDARTWEPIKVIGSNGDSTTAAFLIQQTNGTSRKKSSEDVLTTYPVDLSNIANPIALFDLSYFGYTGVIGAGTDTANTFKAYYNDTLRVDISTDCGQTFKPTGYKKTKVDLTTALRTYNSLPLYGPKITEYTDWRREVIDLSAYKGQVVQLRFVHIAPGDAFTNTLYLDNFQFINYEDKNISLLNWVSPNDMSVLCSEEAFPVEVRLVNEGRTAIDSFDIKYQIDNLPEIKELAQLKLNTNETKAYRFENLLRGVKSGEHTLRVVIHIAGDTISAGDTLVRKIMVGANYTVPVIETFEPTNTINFPPQDWHIEDRNFSFNKNWGRSSGEDRDGNLTYTAVCYTNQSSLKEQDALTTWNVNLKNMKNPYLIFDIAAYSTYLQNFDTFRIDYSTDCGYNFKPTVYKKYNAQFNTAPNPNSVSISFPKRNQWRSDSVRLFNLKDSVVQFRFFAIVKPTFGMVIHLDNVRVIELPVSKTEDINDTPQYSHVFPNPTTGNLIIQFNENLGHEAIDCQLKNIQGQIVKHEKLYNTNQNNWNLNDLPAGMYFLFVGINNQFDRHKIILIK